MLCINKKITLFTKIIVFFVMSLLSLSLFAKSSVVHFDQGSLDKISCTEIDCYFPEIHPDNQNIYLKGHIVWNSDKNLVLHTKGSIVFEKDAKITGKGDGSIILKSGMEPGIKEQYIGTVLFEGETIQIEMLGGGEIKIYYNPSPGDEKHKYHNPSHYFYDEHVKIENVESRDDNRFNSYMLVNNVVDLQNIIAFLSGSYALSQDIDAKKTRNWYQGKGFRPLKIATKGDMPFSGNFDGNGYSITGLYINRPDEEEVGLFGGCYGVDIAHNTIENLTLKDFDITGYKYVGSLAGVIVNSDLLTITVINPKIKSRNISGGLGGSIFKVNMENIQIINPLGIEAIRANEHRGLIAGGIGESHIGLLFATEQNLFKNLKKYYQLGTGYRDSQTNIHFRTKNNQTEVSLDTKNGHTNIYLKSQNEQIEIYYDGVRITTPQHVHSKRFISLFSTLLYELFCEEDDKKVEKEKNSE